MPTDLSPPLPRPWLRRLVAGTLVLLAVAGVGAVLVWLSPVARVQAFGALLWTEARIQPQRIPGLQRALDPWLPSRSVLIVGDSFAGMLPPRWVDSRAVNFGLGGATVDQVREQLGQLRSPGAARAVVIFAGSNDLVHRSVAAAETDLRALLAALPAALPVLLCTVPPVNPAVQRRVRPPAAIDEINARWAVCAAERPRTHLVRIERVLADRSGGLLPELDLGDGLHLNAEGNRRLAALVRQALAEIAP